MIALFVLISIVQPSTPLFFVPAQVSDQAVDNTDAAVDDTSNDKSRNTLERWEDKDVRLLITSWSDHRHLFTGKNTKKGVFSKIAEAFNSVSKHAVTGDQCMRKWSKLVIKYKEVEDHNKLTGRQSKTWKFSDEMSSCLEGNPTVSPVSLLESSSTSSIKNIDKNELSAIDDDDDDKISVNFADSDDSSSTSSNNIELKAGNNKRQCRKRKSRSSAAEMIDFLKEYSQQREKAEEEKLKVLKEMKEEKKDFYGKFLDLMGKKGT